MIFSDTVLTNETQDDRHTDATASRLIKSELSGTSTAMPQKLDVEEALTFLFTALDACNVRLDYGRVGDAVGLSPAAARMRFTRLKKAVERGEFQNALLVQANAKIPAARVGKCSVTQSSSSNVARRTDLRVSDVRMADVDGDEHSERVTAIDNRMYGSTESGQSVLSPALPKVGTLNPERASTSWNSRPHETFSSNIDYGREDEVEGLHVSFEDNARTYTAPSLMLKSVTRTSVHSSAEDAAPSHTHAAINTDSTNPSSLSGARSPTPMFFHSPTSPILHDIEGPPSRTTTHSSTAISNSFLDDDDPLSILADFDPNMHRARYTTTATYRR